MAASPRVLLSSSILLPPPSHCAFIPSRKISAPSIKNVLGSVFLNFVKSRGSKIVLRANAYVGNCLYGKRAVLSVGEEQEVFPSRDQFPVVSRQNIGSIFPYETKPSVDDVVVIHTHRNDKRKI